MWNIHNNNSNITLINLDFGKKEKKFSYIIGDACIMPFINNSFDVIFSNSVIEHVGDFDRQKSFAKEINRIGKKHWVQTPYKHFPLEPHFLFPFFQYFPLSFKVWIALKWPFSFIKINKSDPVKEAKEIRLLNIKEFKELFPNSNIIKEKFWGLTKSLIAYSSEN